MHKGYPYSLLSLILCLLSIHISNVYASMPMDNATMAVSMEPDRLSDDAIVAASEGDEFGEDGFVRRQWHKDPLILGEGTFRRVHVKQAAVKRIMDHNGNREKTPQEVMEGKQRVIRDMLAEVKDRILSEEGTVFTEKDFNVQVIVPYHARKSAWFDGKDSKTKRIYVDWSSFKNRDFLYIVIKHELTDIKIKENFPDTDSALRELFTHLNVNIQEFRKLCTYTPDRAKQLLDDYADIAHHEKGLYPRYVRILNGDFNTPMEDVVIMLASNVENAYFKSMQVKMKRVLSPNNPDSVDVRIREYIRNGRHEKFLRDTEYVFLTTYMQRMQKLFSEIPHLNQKELLHSFAEEFGENVPKGLRIFEPYKDRIQCRHIATTKRRKPNTDEYVYLKTYFLRIPIVQQCGQLSYVYMCIGENDDIESVLGDRGHFMGLTLKQWMDQTKNVFFDPHEGIEKDRRVLRDQLKHMSVNQMIDAITGKKHIEETLHAYFRREGMNEKARTAIISQISNKVFSSQRPGKTRNAVAKTCERYGMSKPEIDAIVGEMFKAKYYREACRRDVRALLNVMMQEESKKKNTSVHDLSFGQTWLSIENKIFTGSRQGVAMINRNQRLRSLYNTIKKDYIEYYVDYIRYPKLLHGSVNPRLSAVKDLAIWPVSDTNAVSSAIVGWMLPGSKHDAPLRYNALEKVSLGSILKSLQTQTVKIDSMPSDDSRNVARIPVLRAA